MLSYYIYLFIRRACNKQQVFILKFIFIDTQKNKSHNLTFLDLIAANSSMTSSKLISPAT
jgi:hypothetical protein